jgi:hypothetical protein
MIYFFKKLLGIGGFPYRYDQLFDLAKEISPLNIMEVGVWTGERAKKLISIASRAYNISRINYYGFDLFETMDDEKFNKELSKQPPSIDEVREKLSKTGANIHLYKGDTTKVLPQVYESLPKMDLVFIDGGHSLETIKNDWLYASKLMHDKTVVIFDDYWLDRVDAGAKAIVDSIDIGEYSVSVLPVTDSFSVTSFGPLRIKLAKVTKFGS